MNNIGNHNLLNLLIRRKSELKLPDIGEGQLTLLPI